MRLVHTILPVVVLALAPCSLRAQTAAAAPLSATDDPAPRQQSAPVPSPSSLDIPIEKIADMTGGCALLDKDFPGLRAHPMYPYFKVMTLNQIAAMSKGDITPDMLAQARTDLSTLESGTPAVSVATTAPTPATPVAATVVSTTTAAAQ